MPTMIEAELRKELTLALKKMEELKRALAKAGDLDRRVSVLEERVREAKKAKGESHA
jgi:hypothetical protein